MNCMVTRILAYCWGACLYFSPAVHGQTEIPSTESLDASFGDRPGFIWNVFQNAANQENTIARAEAALRGQLVDGSANALPNHADPARPGAAIDPGVRLSPAANALVQFEIASVINLSENAGDGYGSIVPDQQMPGIPGVTDGADGIAAEALTWLLIPAGEHRWIVNSDDGFRLRIGGAGPGDALARTVGEFNGGRGADDTLIHIRVLKPGLYAAQLLWEEGGGGANLEWVEILPAGTRVPINSPTSRIKAYRTLNVPAPAVLSRIAPAPNSVDAPFDAPIRIDLAGAGAISPDSIQLRVDGTPVTADITQTGNNFLITYLPQVPYPPRSRHDVSLHYNEGQPRVRTWSFNVMDYAVLTSADRVDPDVSQPGFIWRVHQNGSFQENSNLRAAHQLAGELGPNHANANAVSTALGPGTPGLTPNHPIEFQIPTVINLNQDAAGPGSGEIVPDAFLPGIPGTDAAPSDGIAAEILTYVELPAGISTFVVNSDDGFVAWTGHVDDVLRRQRAGEFNGGRGANDTEFRVFAEVTGVFPFRLLWEEGGGGASIEWKVVRPDSSRVLVNDTANGGARAFRAITSVPPTAVTRIYPAPDTTEVPPDASIQVTIRQGTSLVDPGSIRLFLDGTPVIPNLSAGGPIIKIEYKPAVEFAPNTTHFVRLEFLAGSARTEDWSFLVPSLSRDRTHGYPAFMQPGGAGFSADRGGRSGQVGDFAIDFGAAGSAPSVHVADASFLNHTTPADEMSVSVWQRLHNTANTSTFWINAPSAGIDRRAWQAHVPWGDGLIYFDTAGCCDAEQQRIQAPITNAPSFTGPAWWTNWHHFVFTKKGNLKQIWIDGRLFLSGSSTAVLPNDITDMYIGSQSATDNILRGVIDELAFFRRALTGPHIHALSTGAPPASLSPNPGLLAHWDFNDASASLNPEQSTNIPVARGFSLIRNPFSIGQNTLNEVIPEAVEGTTVFTYDRERQRFNSSVYFDGIRWLPNERVPPGIGMFIAVGDPGFIPFRGQPVEPPAEIPLAAGLNLVSSILAREGLLQNDLQFPPLDGETVYQYGPGGYRFSTYDSIFGWDLGEPRIAFGEAFWIRAQQARIWRQTGGAPFPADLADLRSLKLPNRTLHQADVTMPMGELQFANIWPSVDSSGETNTIVIPIGPPANRLGVGDQYHAHLWIGTATSGLQEIPREENRPTVLLERGRFHGGPVRVPLMQGLMAQVRAWPTNYSNFESARQDPATMTFESNEFPITPAMEPNAPAFLAGLNSFRIKPPLQLVDLPAFTLFGTAVEIVVSGQGDAAPIISVLPGDANPTLSQVDGRYYLSTSRTGIVTIVVQQRASGSYLASQITRQIEVRPAPQEIHFSMPGELNLGWHDLVWDLPVTSSVGERLSYSISPQLAGIIVEPNRTYIQFDVPGEYRITARQPGGGNYLAAQPVTNWVNAVRFAISSGNAPGNTGARSFLVTAATNSVVTVEWATELPSRTWTTLDTRTVTARTTTFTDQTPQNQTRFYRARTLP